MKTSKKMIAAMALTLGFIGTAASSASAYSYSDTLSTGNRVVASFTKATSTGFRARLEATNICNFMSVDLSKDAGSEGFVTLAHDGGHKENLASVRADANASDDLLAVYFINDSGTKWSHAIEYNSGSFEDQ